MLLLFNLKKFFYDAWDNLYSVVIFNVVNVAFMIGLVSIPVFLVQHIPMYLIFALESIICILFFAYLGLQSFFAFDIVNYKTPDSNNFLEYLKKSWLISILLGMFFTIFNGLFLYNIIYYANSESTLLLSVFMIWLFVTLSLSSLYFLPIFVQLEQNPIKILKKSVLIFIDNPLYTIFNFLFLILILSLSILSLFTFPGVMGAMVFLQSAFKLRFYKYDYLQANPNSTKIPWEELISNDDAKIGKRTIKELLFPWKD